VEEHELKFEDAQRVLEVHSARAFRATQVRWHLN